MNHRQNRDCSVLGLGLNPRTETETEHPVAPRDRTETNYQYTETRPSSIFLNLGSLGSLGSVRFGSVRGSRGILGV